MNQRWAEKDCSLHRGCCAPSGAPCFCKAPRGTAEGTSWRVTSCLLSALPEVGENESSRKCDMHFLRRWKGNVNCRMEKRPNPRIAGWDFPPTREERQKLSEHWQPCHSECQRAQGKLCVQSLFQTSCETTESLQSTAVNDPVPNLNAELQHKTPCKERQGEGRDGVEYLPNTCNTSSPDVPRSVPSGSHPQGRAGEVGQPGECTGGVRNAGCLPHAGRWILHPWRWEGGDGQHQKTRRCEVNAIYQFYQHQVFCSAQTGSGYEFDGSQSSRSPFSQKYFSSFLLVHTVNHCGFADSVQEEIHPYVTLLHWSTNTAGDCSGQ